MSELRSKCCGAKVIEYHYSYMIIAHPIKGSRGLKEYKCEKCKKKPTEVEEKEKTMSEKMDKKLNIIATLINNWKKLCEKSLSKKGIENDPYSRGFILGQFNVLEEMEKFIVEARKR